MCWYSTLAGLVMGIKMRPLVLGLSSGQTWPENHAPLFGGFDGDQAVTTCGLSSLASFPKILSSKHVCCVFRDIRDKYAVNQGFWSKTAVFSLSATKVHCLLIFWLPHLYNLLQPEDPGVRTEDRGLRTED